MATIRRRSLPVFRVIGPSLSNLENDPRLLPNLNKKLRDLLDFEERLNTLFIFLNDNVNPRLISAEVLIPDVLRSFNKIQEFSALVTGNPQSPLNVRLKNCVNEVKELIRVVDKRRRTFVKDHQKLQRDFKKLEKDKPGQNFIPALHDRQGYERNRTRGLGPPSL